MTMVAEARPAPSRTRCPDGYARQDWNARTAVAMSATPLESRCENSIRVVMLGSGGKTSPLQSGQWLPQPAPDPVARTTAPQRMTATLMARAAHARDRTRRRSGVSTRSAGVPARAVGPITVAMPSSVPDDGMFDETLTTVRDFSAPVAMNGESCDDIAGNGYPVHARHGRFRDVHDMLAVAVQAGRADPIRMGGR